MGLSFDWSPQHHGGWAGWYFLESAKWPTSMLQLIAPNFDLPISKLWNINIDREREREGIGEAN